MYIRLHNSCTYQFYQEWLEIRSDTRGITYKIKGFPKDILETLLKHLNNGIPKKDSLAFLVEKIGAKIKQYEKQTSDLINFLIKKEFLVERKELIEQSLQDTLYDRQIRFLSSFETNTYSGEDFNELLQNRKVVIVGLGAYGTWLALHCSRMGIKQIIGIDYDIVESSNLHRQILYSRKSIQKSKSFASNELITAVDPSIYYQSFNIEIKNAKELLPFIKNADLVFNAFGYFPEEEAQNIIPGFIAQACIAAKVPMLCLSTNWLGPLYIPDQSACYFCTVNHEKLRSVIQKSYRNDRVNKRAFGPILAMTCSLATLEAARFLSGIDIPKIAQGLLALDPFQMDNTRFIPIEIDNNCMCTKQCML